jgi:hypothetical protein
MSKKANWAALAVDWYEDEVIDVIADEEPAVMWLWPVLVAMSKRKSHIVENPRGDVRVSLKRLASMGRVDVGDVENALRLMEEGELVTVEAMRVTGVVSVSLRAFDAWQHPNSSPADRKRKERLQGNHADMSHTGHGDVTNGHVLSQNVTTQHNTTQHNTTQELLSEKQASRDDSGIKKVFDHWVSTTWNGRGVQPKLSPKRKTRIGARLKDGWTVEQLTQVLDGYAADPFYSGQQDGKPKLEIAYRLGSTEEVERGLQLATAPATPGSGPSAPLWKTDPAAYERQLQEAHQRELQGGAA